MRNMRHIYTVSIDTELEKKLDSYQEENGFETRSEGAIQLLKKGLRYDTDMKQLQDEVNALKSKPNEIHIPCSVCKKPMSVRETIDDPIYKDIKDRYKNWGHSRCINTKESGR
jgi:hypothetical protein